MDEQGLERSAILLMTLGEEAAASTKQAAATKLRGHFERLDAQLDGRESSGARRSRGNGLVLKRCVKVSARSPLCAMVSPKGEYS